MIRKKIIVTGELQAELNREREAVASLHSRAIRCPYCLHKAVIVYDDARGHVQTKCKSCGRENIFNITTFDVA